MKKNYLLFIMLTISFYTNAIIKTINVIEPGSLTTLLTPIQKLTITKLIITGNIDARDFQSMNVEISNLNELDLSDANINEYLDYNMDISIYGQFYPANEIPFYAFNSGSSAAGNKMLQTVTFPKSITSIGYNSFWASNLSGSLILPNTVTHIGSEAFGNCIGLTGELLIPNSVKKIDYFAFQGCAGLNGNLNFPNSITSIGYASFAWCSGLDGIVSIPKSVTSIGDSPFSNCTKLKSISVASDNEIYTSFEDVLFNKSKTTLIQCPAGKVGSYSIPNSVDSIRMYAFGQCSQLSGVLTLPNSIKFIGQSAFYKCSGFTGNLILSSGLNKIEYGTFGRCTGIQNLTIPNSITLIDDYAFEGCTNLSNITVFNEIPPVIKSTTFASVNKTTCKLIVPKGSINKYRSVDYWKDFLQIIENQTTNNYFNESSKIYVYNINSNIIIEGTSSGESIDIYNISGILLRSIKSNNERTTINMAENAPYILKINNKIFKVKL